MNKLSIAIILATNSHKDQLDKAGELYIFHPLRVMLKMKTEDERIVAVLHDVLEDTKCSESTIDFFFGQEILDAVKSVTRIEKPVKETYFDFVKRSKLHPIGRKVKIADLEDNMSDERMAALPQDEKDIIKRYKKAMKILNEE
jgi:(p)ppGpp synthase/HD superfamily hydrolase